MDNYKWLIVVLITIGRSFDDAKADCVSPDSPCSDCTVDHQLESEESLPVNSYLTWTCNAGFTMEGDADAIVWVCGINGKWLGDKPNCTVMTCSSPPIPANGLVENRTLIGNYYTPGDAIQYTCDTGYDLNNTETTSTCLSNGTWTYMEPFCKIQCLDGKKSFPEQNSCFDVPADDMAWDEARECCRKKGGFLALVKNDKTQHFLKANFVIGEGLWIGGKAGRHWKWSSDGRNITRLFWNEDEPSGGENCIEIRQKIQQNDWNDEDCNNEKGFICQFNSSACSVKYEDTESHRVLYRGDCYRFFNSSSTWDVGRTYCEAMGGYLAEILDRSAQDFISDEVKRLYGDDKQWWIGGHVGGQVEPRSWFWIDNTRISATHWAIDEPNDFDGDEDCIELSNSTNLKWNDENCAKERRYVCQFGLPTCGDPGEPLHGSRTPSDTSTFLDGATIAYQCDLGYEVQGSTSATCMLNGRWDTERPVCEAVTCLNNTFEVDNVVNVTVTSKEYRGVAVYTCSPGYLPNASPVSYCQADGTWSNPNFTCIAMTTPPTEPETNPLSTSSKPDAVSSAIPSPSAGEISTQPSGGEPQPKPNVAAIAGGISATLIVIILLILAVALTRKRKRPSSKNGQEMILGNERDLKPEANNYSIVDNRKPVTAAGTDNRAFAGDTTGNGHVNVIVQSEPEPRNAPSEDETQFVGADMVENALYGANDSASGQGSRDGTPNVQLLGVAARYVVTDDLPIPNVQLEGALSKSIPTYGRVDKSQSQMVENELYGETDKSERHQMYEVTGIDLKDAPTLQTEMNSAPNDGMVDNELYAVSPDDATYQEVEENDQEVIFEEDNDSMVDNALYSASDVTGHVGREGGTVYQNEEYHDVPDYLADNELYNMK